MPRSFPALLVAAALLGSGAVPAPLSAQGAPLTVETRLGAALPVSSFSGGDGVGEGADAGVGYGVEVTLGGGWRTWYAGFSQMRFGCGQAGCPAGAAYVTTGVNAGVRVALAPGSRLIPWVGVGAFTTRVESPGVRGSPEGVSELGFGAEAAAGLWLQASRHLAITPAARVSRVGTELPGGERLSLRYLVLDVGLALTF